MDPYLYPLSECITVVPAQPNVQDYGYEGRCPRTGDRYRLPRTALAKAVAQALMDMLATDPQALGEGKMYGVLLVRMPGQAGAGPHPKSRSPQERGFDGDPFRPPSPTGREAGDEGQIGVLKAFSGLWRGQAQRPGWVPPIPGREQVALLEAQTLDQLHRLKTRLHHLNTLPERETYAHLVTDFDQQRQALNRRHRQRREDRTRQRQHLMTTLSGEELATALAVLEQASRGDKAEKRDFKRRQAEALETLNATIQAADAEMQALKRRRRALSQQLQAAMHAVYRLTNFAGESLTLAEIQALGLPSGLPTGTGDCCAPKLLHYAAQRGWQPLAMAEFWWGPPLGDRQSGQFYGACEERCQPILGFLLAGLSAGLASSSPNLDRSTVEDIPILYLDDWVVVVNKPAGLLSVPGRYGNRQDSVLSRLRLTLPGGESLRPVHRLDQATSGILVLARTAESHRHLSQQFAQRRVKKVYEALLDGTLPQPSGWIDLPLSPDPDQPPRQRVDWPQGKPSQTYFEVLAHAQGITRVEFTPHTGRTHQLRVHAAHPQGLNAPIVGDSLYGHTHRKSSLATSDSPGVHCGEPKRSACFQVGLAPRMHPTVPPFRSRDDGIRTGYQNPEHPRAEIPDQRLHLHAKALTLTHPYHQTPMTLTAPVPF